MEKTTQTTTTSKETSSHNFEKKAFLLINGSTLKKERDKNVLIQRYGLGGNDPRTLEAIGKDLGVTRERVRQIEKTAFTKLIKASSDHKEISEIHGKINTKIGNFGGFVNEERLVSAFIPTKKQTPKEINAFLFLLNLHSDIRRHGENKETRTYWTQKNTDLKKLKDISVKIDNLFESKKKVLPATSIADSISENIEETESMLYIKKNVLKTEEKEWGLITWREVNPKSIRDKTYVIMKKHNKPLHYTELADKISNHKLQKKPITKQAVHNELIRDERFVLIGRGIYALNEWGYEHGVVEDVIKKILTEHGEPMHKDEIVKHVKKQRIVKETTVILNLQKNSFKRVARATYTLQDEE